jgi:ketosteroid isomerase-like protein
MASQSDASTTESVLEHHLTAFGNQDMAEILADYTDESVVITDTETHRGLAEIETWFEAFFAEFSQPHEFEMDAQTVEGDVAHIAWHGETPERTYEFATDTFVVRDGVIETQTFAAETTPK